MAHVPLKEQKLPSLTTLRAAAALKSPHLAVVRPARIGLGFEVVPARHKSLAQLEDTLGGPGRLALPYALRLLLDAMSGLGALHRSLGFVHGEVQPEHVLIGDDGLGRLLPVVRAHWVRGEERRPDCLHYLAPEKLLGDAVDVRADVFSVGVLLWEALAGKPLLDAQGVDEIISSWMKAGIARPCAPEDESWTEPLSSIAERALALDPARRFPTIGEMRAAIEQACARYLASTPGMAELFHDPKSRARGAIHDSAAPDSQRITLPPHQAPATIKPRPSSEPPPAPTVPRLQPLGLAAYDLEEELTTKPNAAPIPAAALRAHVATLNGHPPPFVETHDERTTPTGRIPRSVPVLITPIPQPPATPVTLATARVPARSTTPVSLPAPPPHPPPSVRPAPSTRPAASLSPLVAAKPVPSSVSLPDASFDSFELLRPRQRRGAWWLLLGGLAAVAAFAARPWLSARFAAGAREPDSGNEPGLTPAAAPAASALLSAAPDPTAPPRSVSSVAMPRTPGVPRNAPRPRGPREGHVVIEDVIDPSIQALREVPSALPSAPPAALTGEPEVESPPASPVPASPREVPKSAPPSSSERYGI